MYNNDLKQLNLPAIDAEMLKFWQENRIFEQSVAQRDPEKSFVFFEGPPSANGQPGIHHVMARTVKDLFCRYNTLRGFRVERKGGWDTHGLPIELQVEKELGITKEDIGKKITVDEYNSACRATVMRYKDRWDDITRKMGYWVDLDDPYITFNNEYIETCWWLLKRLYEKKTNAGDSYLYKGFTIQPFSPAAGTGLSTHELNMPGTYKDVTDTTIVAMFKVRPDERSAFLFEEADEDVRIMAWTTTPWTLPSNIALTVGPDIRYAKVKTLSPYTGAPVSLVLAQERLSAYFKAEDEGLDFENFKVGDKSLPYKVVQTCSGRDLEGVRYEQLIPLPHLITEAIEARGFRVITGDFVTTEDGTGVVHTAPYFGADDFKVCKAAGVPFIGVFNEKQPDLPFPLVDRQGRFVPEVSEWGGRYVKAEYYSKAEQEEKDFKPTDLLIALRLKEDNKAFRVEKYKHPYPHCWRTDKPVLYYPLDSWFIRASAAKERLSELNKTINWKPESTGTGRFGAWLDNLQDWNLSRSRYWGVPLPIWRTEDGSEERCVGSVLELSAEVDKSVAAGLMVSNPYIAETEEAENALHTYVFTGDPAVWEILKAFGRGMRRQPTEAEHKLWQALRNRQIDGFKFRRQHAIGSYIVDFVCIREKLVVELDGEYHDTVQQQAFDSARTTYLNALGFRVLRFKNQEVLANLEAVILALRAALTSPPSPLSKGEGENDGHVVGNSNNASANAQALSGTQATPGSFSPSPSERGPGGEVDLHRPYIDDIILVSPGGKPMYRETDLIDVWFDSGAMPYAQWGLDYEKLKNGDEKPFRVPFNTSYPATFIAEGVDQTRGWFYTLHAIAGMCFDSVAYKNVVSNGLVLDKNGEKMSKSKGNVVNPFETIDQFGADATRWYMIANANPWDNLKFDADGILEVRNKLFGTLFNTYSFFALYANLDGWTMDESKVMPYNERSELDRWVISKLYSLVEDYRAAMDDYEPTRAARVVENFVDEHLSNWYVRLSRRRFWRGELNADKQAAYQTLFECLTVVAQLSASLAPFFSDWLYRNLTAPIREQAKAMNSPLRHESVHLTDLVQPDASKVDKDLEKRMDYAQRICSLALSIRKKEKIRVRLPLQKLLLPVLDASFIAEVDGVKDLILAEINVKDIEYVTDSSGLLKKSAKANFKTLGGKLGKDMKDAAAFIAAMSNEDISALEKSGSLAVTFNGNAYTLTPEDLLLSTEDLPGWKTASDGALTVALDVTLTPELLAEGTARDLVNRIQNLRKENDFNVTDRIAVSLERHSAIEDAVLQFGEYIKAEVLADSLEFGENFQGEKVELNDEVSLNIDVRVN